jgi:hypothetical protein
MPIQSYQHDLKYAVRTQYAGFSTVFVLSWHFERSDGIPDCSDVNLKTTENH